METHSLLSIPHGSGGVPVYMACPPSQRSKAGLILTHEVWGLTDHIKDVADRLCKEGYEVIAPDLMAGTKVEKFARADLAEALFDPVHHADKQVELRALFTPLQSPEFTATVVAKLQSCFKCLTEKQQVSKVGVMGFCFGGTYSFNLAIAQPGLACAVPYYGHCDHTDDEIAKINCPILAFYGDQDTPLTDKLPALESQMQKSSKDFRAKVYPGAKHAFFNDTNPITYNKSAAEDSWQLALDFLSKNLK